MTENNRRTRLGALLAEHGLARECHPSFARLGRFALMEADEGPADNGGPWWSTGDDARQLLIDSIAQDEPSWWPAKLLVDLDTGAEHEPTISYRVEELGI